LAVSEDLEGLRRQFRSVRDVLRNNGSYLATTVDDPPEERQPADPDRDDDDVNFEERNVCDTIEPDKSNYVAVGGPLPRTDRNFFKFFLDGAIRTYHLGEQTEGGRGYPLVAAEVGSAAIRREEDGGTSVAGFARWIGWVIPPCPPMLRKTRSALLEICRGMKIAASRFNLDAAALEPKDLRWGIDLRTALFGKAMAQMKSLERKIAVELRREEGEWLVLDAQERKKPSIIQDLQEDSGEISSRFCVNEV